VITVVRPALRTEKGRTRLVGACSMIIGFIGVVTLIVAVIEMNRPGGVLHDVASSWSRGISSPFYGFPLLACFIGVYLFLTRHLATRTRTGVAILIMLVSLLVMSQQLEVLRFYAGGRSSGPAL